MKLFEDVTPCKVKCKCGQITELANSNKEIWRILNNRLPPERCLVTGLDCKHNPFQSQVSILDKNGVELKKMDKQSIGMRYYILKAYKNVLDVKEDILEFYSDVMMLIFPG